MIEYQSGQPAAGRAGDSPGTLYIVATPIGNLDDLTLRAGKVLASVALVVAEDTRRTGQLLQHLGLRKSMLTLHDHNEREQVRRVIAELNAGRDLALVSDAGTPLISDPGYIVVREARASGIRVVPVPGPSALITALSAAGLPTDRFLFAGFLPAKRAGRRAQLESLRREGATLVFYESPHRILDTLDDMAEVMGGQRELVVARELTKAFESFYAGTLAQVRKQLQADPNATRGEFVLVLRGAGPDQDRDGPESLDVDRMLCLLMDELPLRKAAKIVAEATGLSKNELYQRALALKESRH